MPPLSDDELDSIIESTTEWERHQYKDDDIKDIRDIMREIRSQMHA